MGKISRPFRCEIVTPEGVLDSLEVLSVVFPATDGLVGVLGGRAPLASSIGAGPLTIEETSGQQQHYYVAGGFARMNENLMTILAEECISVDQLDPDAIWEEILEASKLPLDTDAQMAHRDEVLHAARTKFKLAQERRRKLSLGEDEPAEEDAV